MKPRPKGYFHFPICALCFAQTYQARLDAIIAYGAVEAGKVLWRKMPPAKRQELLEKWQKHRAHFKVFDPENEDHVGALCGTEVIGITCQNFKSLLDQHEKLRAFVEAFESRNGPDALVRLRTDLVFGTRDNKGLKYRELTVLAAIYSVIGAKSGPVRITRKTINIRALGYKSAAVYLKEHNSRQDSLKILTEFPLRSTIERLHSRKFFVRAVYGCRFAYYSSRMSNAGLRKAVIDRHTQRDFSKAIHRAEDEEMTAAIKNHRALLQGKSPPAPGRISQISDPLNITDPF